MSHSVKAVKYTGQADTRSISRQEWEAIKVVDQASTVWDASNNKELPGAQFVDGAIEYFRRDGEFELVEETSEA